MTESEADAAARLLERLLTDPGFRAGFRNDPVGTSRAAGLDSVADEMALAGGKATDTLDMRESRSSLAGVLLAAAFEGAAIYELAGDVLPHLEGIPEPVGQVLSRVHLPAVAQAQAATPQAGAAPAAYEAAAAPAGFEVPPAPDPNAGEFRAITPDRLREPRPAEAPQARAAGAPDDDAAGAPRERVDPSQYGAEGTGGRPSPETLALLRDKHVTLDPDGIGDLRSGRIDPRVVSVLRAIGRDHDITVSAMLSDHDQFTAGGSVSNHYVGRAFDIATLDGQPVGPGNEAARRVAEQLSRLPESIRPSEIGSPWALSGPAYFTDGAHQNHLHVGFDDPISPNWKPPEDLAATDAAPAPANGALPADGAMPAVAPAIDVDADDGGDLDEAAGLEDPGGDTDAEADEESDGEDDDNDSISDDPSDEAEDEDEEDEDEGADAGVSDDGETDDDDSDDESDDDSEDDSDDSEDDSEDDGEGLGGGAGGLGEQDGGGGSGSGLDLGDVAGGYPGDDAPKARIAAWMGAEAEKRGLPPELPVMAGLVESGLRNVNYGDADSVGFFQMRVSIWNTGSYTGYADDAELQLKWFLDHAVAVKKQRMAAGQPVDDPGSYGEWVADVERPAAQYRGRYQLRLEEARNLLEEGGGARPAGRGGSGAGEELDALGGGVRPGPRALEAVATARKYLGTPYQWGGSTPRTGFDCSGLVQWAYAKAGIRIPRVTDQQIEASNGTPVDRRHLLPGDLVFFRDSSGYVHHVGMSLGGDKFIHAPHTGDVVKVSSLKEPYYADQFTGGRRFDHSAGREAAGAARAAVAGRPAVAAGEAAVEPGRDEQAARVRAAEAALANDAAEAQRPGTILFEAVRAQELRKASVATPP